MSKKLLEKDYKKMCIDYFSDEGFILKDVTKFRDRTQITFLNKNKKKYATIDLFVDDYWHDLYVMKQMMLTEILKCLEKVEKEGKHE